MHAYMSRPEILKLHGIDFAKMKNIEEALKLADEFISQNREVHPWIQEMRAVVWGKGCFLFVVCCLLFVVCCLLFAVCCLLFVVCCLFVCLLVVGCCLLFIVCCFPTSPIAFSPIGPLSKEKHPDRLSAVSPLGSLFYYVHQDGLKDKASVSLEQEMSMEGNVGKNKQGFLLDMQPPAALGLGSQSAFAASSAAGEKEPNVEAQKQFEVLQREFVNVKTT